MAVFNGARRRGCSVREAEVLATYVESDKYEDTAFQLGVSRQTVKNTLIKIYRKLDVPHAAAAVARVLTN